MMKMQAEYFNPEALADVFKKIESQESTVDTLVMSSIMHASFRRLGRDVLDNDILTMDGNLGILWGAKIELDEHLSKDVIIFNAKDKDKSVELTVAFSSPEKEGIITALTNITATMNRLQNELDTAKRSLGHAKEIS